VTAFQPISEAARSWSDDNECCEGCDLVAGAAATAEDSLIDTEKAFHDWGDVDLCQVLPRL